MSSRSIVRAIKKQAREGGAHMWAPGSPFRLPVEEVVAELGRILARDGELSATSVLLAAVPENAPLHSAFEWRDTVAAHEHRLETARRLTRSILWLPPEGNPVRAFVSVPIDPLPAESQPRRPTYPAYVYQPIQRVMEDADQREALLRRARASLESWQRIYDGLEEFAAVYAAIRQIAS